ncbi:CBS domain-containing protein [Dyella flagellata]|uniref:CBS domain-containing protein n=1 Tax=Dyella flagellata TaxID=1867833 RepID=A0ABQ5XAY8_9GAMM|nr:CBS domain-containing protein [Dyella flagellata]GLQ87786.1 CBS domain-containing protein [Dyella flagellata]
MTTIKDVMTRDVKIVSPDQSLRDAAMAMAAHDIGALPVGDHDRLVGLITDRDIAIKGVAKGKSVDTAVREVMCEGIKYCFEDEDVVHVADNMADLGIRRLPVVDRQKRLVGIVSLSNICHGHDNARNSLLEGVARPH